MYNFNIDFSKIPPDPHTGQGLRHPSPDSTSSALRRFALRASLGTFGPFIVLFPL